MRTHGTKPRSQHFWNVADDFIDSGRVEEGSMMGNHCLRAVTGGELAATVERSSGNLVVMLPEHVVTGLVEAGEGLAFAPAGKVFREWAAIPKYDADRWFELVEESIEFVSQHKQR